MSWTIIYGLAFVTFSLPGNKALNKDKLLKGCSRSLLVTRALLLLLNRLPNSNIRAFSLSSCHLIIVCWTWQRVIHHCCSEVWSSCRVLLCKACTSTSSCSQGSRANRQQGGQKLKSNLFSLLTWYPVSVCWLPNSLLCHQLGGCPPGITDLLCAVCMALPITAFFTGFHSAGGELTSLLFPCSSYFHLVPCTDPLWCWEGSQDQTHTSTGKNGGTA